MLKFQNLGLTCFHAHLAPIVRFPPPPFFTVTDSFKESGKPAKEAGFLLFESQAIQKNSCQPIQKGINLGREFFEKEVPILTII